MAKQTLKVRRRRRMVVNEKNMQNSSDRSNISLLRSPIYKQKKLHKKHLRCLHPQKQECGECKTFISIK